MQTTVVKETHNTKGRRTIIQVIMDELMKEMQALNERREAEMRSLRTKCNEHETMISTFKKILQVDKLQNEFDVYKHTATSKMKVLEETLSQAQKTIENLNQERKTVEERCKQLQTKLLDVQNQFAKEQKSTDNKLQKKIDSLEKELINERTRCSKLEDTITKLESKPKEKHDANGALNLKQFPNNSTTVDLVNNAVTTTPKISLTPITLLTQSPNPKRRKT